MPTFSEFPATGRILAIADDAVTFLPLNTNYEMKLETSGRLDVPLNQRIEALIRCKGRKVLTVTSGGNFIAPIFGPPRIVQGRIRHLEEDFMVVHAGAPVIVELPQSDASYDMERGPLAVGQMVNVTILPGAMIELAQQAAAK